MPPKSRPKPVLEPSRLPSRLEDHLGYWLRFVSNHVSWSFARRLEVCNITVSEWVALRHLYDVAECSPSELAKRMGMNKGAVSRLIARLLVKRLAERYSNDRDGRAQILRITRLGRKLVPKLAALADENDRVFFSQLSPSTREYLLRAMRSLVQQHNLKRLPVE